MAVLEAFKTHSNERAASARIAGPVLWLSVLCLDAPVVAITWQFFFAGAFHYPLNHWESAALFLTAWWIYLADRLVDSLGLHFHPDWNSQHSILDRPISARAAFCLRHKGLFVTALLLVGVTDVFVVILRIPFWLIERGVLLGLAALIYLFVNQCAHQLWKRLPLKEVTVGFLFALGTTLFLFRQVPAHLLTAVFLFGCLCSLNCLSIAVWERQLDLEQGKHSYATEYARGGAIVRMACLLLVVLGCGLALFDIVPLITGAIAAASALLLALHFSLLGTNERTAMADLVLLTPLLFLLF